MCARFSRFIFSEGTQKNYLQLVSLFIDFSLTSASVTLINLVETLKHLLWKINDSFILLVLDFHSMYMLKGNS